MKNEYFPCKLVEHEDYCSVITSDFHFFDDYFGEKGGGGYSVEKLAKKLAKEHHLNKDIRFDSEAGMFCACSKNKESLLQLCSLLQEITGSEDLYSSGKNTQPLISLQEAEKLLLKGFVLDLKTEYQEEFLRNVPFPSLTKKQQEYINALEGGTDEEKIHASKRINSEARTKTRKWDNYLSHPGTVSIFLKAIDKETNSKVYQELIWALVFICSRHLPDLRCKTCFTEALENKNATIRWLGLMGLEELYEYPEGVVLKLKTDKSEKVRKKAEEMLKFGNKREFPVWMFDKENYP
ncbi:MAG: immunity 51 family protein [Bacteroidales bacterium]|nr:immunity 51 family protein [Bacteroidales bacterium]